MEKGSGNSGKNLLPKKVDVAYLLVILRDVCGDVGLWHGEVEHGDAAVAEALDARLHRRLDVRRDVEEERVVHLQMRKRVRASDTVETSSKVTAHKVDSATPE